MVAQMAQFSSLAGISETNTTLQKISEQLTAQTSLLQEIRASTLAPASPETPSTQEGYVHVILYVAFGPQGRPDRYVGHLEQHRQRRLARLQAQQRAVRRPLRLVSQPVDADDRGTGEAPQRHHPGIHARQLRSEERRVGKECVSQCRSRWAQDH